VISEAVLAGCEDLDSDSVRRYARSVEAAVLVAWKRRDKGIATATVVFGVIAVAVAFMLLTRSHNDSGVTLSTRPAQVSPRVHGHLVFGMTPQQVLRRTGHPTKTLGNCWLFSPTKTGIVGSIAVQPSWSRLPYDPRTRGGLKLCFTGGHYSNGYQHIFDLRKLKWVWFAWPQTLMHGTADSYSGGL
jgi:hypothetical protein